MSVISTLDRIRHRGDDADERGGTASTSVDPRIEARRLAVDIERRHRTRRRLLILAVVVSVVAAVYGVTRSALLDVNVVNVSGVNQTVPNDVRNAAGIRTGDRLTDLDLRSSEERIRALPWVLDAAVNRSWNGTIDISVSERTPLVALVGSTPSSWWLVDAGRRVLGALETPPTEIPVIEGVAPVVPGEKIDQQADGAIAVARALTPGLRSRVKSVKVVGRGAIDVFVLPAAVVHLGSADQLDQKIQSMQTVFAQVDLGCLTSVDLRVADAPVLTRDRSCA